jgi:hypothetical protein
MLAGPIDGLESTVNLQNLKCYSPRSSMLGEPAAGDFNGDGSVDKLDLAVWGRQFGQVASGLSADDDDGNGYDETLTIDPKNLQMPLSRARSRLQRAVSLAAVSTCALETGRVRQIRVGKRFDFSTIEILER